MDFCYPKKTLTLPDPTGLGSYSSEGASFDIINHCNLVLDLYKMCCKGEVRYTVPICGIKRRKLSPTTHLLAFCVGSIPLSTLSFYLQLLIYSKQAPESDRRSMRGCMTVWITETTSLVSRNLSKRRMKRSELFLHLWIGLYTASPLSDIFSEFAQGRPIWGCSWLWYLSTRCTSCI